MRRNSGTKSIVEHTGPSAETLRLCIEHAPAAIAILDREQRYLACSRRWLLDYGLGERDLIGLNHFDVFPELPDSIREIHARCLEGAIERGDATPIHWDDGTIDWARWEVRPWRDAEGGIGGLIMLTEMVTARVLAEQALQSREELLKAVEELTHVGGWEFDVKTGKGSWTDEVARIHEVEIEGEAPSVDSGLSYYHGESRRLIEEAVQQAKAGKAYDLELEMLTAKGNKRWVRTIGRPVFQDGRVVSVTGSIQDITEHKQAEEAQRAVNERLRRLNRLYRVTSEINTLIVRVTDRDELFRETCRIAVEKGEFLMVWIGMVPPGETVPVPQAWEGTDESFFHFLHKAREDKRPIGGPAAKALAAGAPVFINDIDSQADAEWRRQVLVRGFHAAAGLPLIVAGRAVGVMCFYAVEKEYFDEEERALLEELAGDVAFALHSIDQRERIDYLTSYDALTGLPNRSLFLERLGSLLESTGPGNRHVAVVLVDLKQFRNINTVYGRAAGDRILQETSRRIRGFTDSPGNVARIGSDIFALMLQGAGDTTGVALRCQRLMAPLNEEGFRLGNEEIRLDFNAGITLFPTDAGDAEKLLHNAEVALKKAKADNAPYMFYRPDMSVNIAELMALQNRLRYALERNEFLLHYQPKVAAGSAGVVGLEALLRWVDTELGMVSPARFIPILEESGLILEVGRWVLARAARDYLQLEKLLPRAPRIAVNVSELQLQQADFVIQVLHATRHDGRQVPLDLEITESLIMKDLDRNIEKLKALQEAGFNISVDDFGTGYSSLSYIARLPLDALKIDRAFVDSMMTNAESATIVATIISLAHSLGLKVVAEGVETREQEAKLGELRCDEMQGYLYSRPQPLDAVIKWLREHETFAS